MTTGKPATEPDTDELDSTFYLVCDIEHITKQVIRAAAHPVRWAMWEAFTAEMETATATSAEYPWEPPEKVTRITARAARDALTATLKAVPGKDEQRRLAKIMATAAERVEERMEAGASGTEVPGKLPARCCANANCGRRFTPKRSSAKFCSPACRTASFKQRQAAKREGNGTPDRTRQPTAG